MTKPNPNNKYPKKTLAAAVATRAMAEKNHRKFIMSARYIMAHMPAPAIINKAGLAKPHTFPAQPGLCSSRDLTATEVHAMTMNMIVNASPSRSDLQYSCQTFLKAIKPFLPIGIVINSDWRNFRERNCTDTTCVAVADELEQFAIDYFNSIEANLASLYLTIGDRAGSQYLKVLERRFRANWNINNSSMSIKASMAAKPADEEEDDGSKSVTFNFEVVQSTNTPSEA